MRNWKVLPAVAASLVVVVSAMIVHAVNDGAPWISAGQPTLSKILDLTPNIQPSSSNHDCLKVTTRYVGGVGMHEDCVTETALGQVGSTGVIFNAASEIIPVVPPAQFFGLNPIPSQSMLVTHNSATPVGLHMHFYRSIQDKLKTTFDIVGGRKQYTLTKNPDFTLRDAAGKSLPINPDTLAYSSNGNWMVVDSPTRGFLRVNLATFEMVPFAPSLNQVSDFGSYAAQISVSSDGRYVAVKPDHLSSFKVYDVQSCTAAVIPVDVSNPRCQSREYWNDLTSRVAGFHRLHQPRFVSTYQLSFDVVYNYVSATNFKVAQYTLTAPGESETGIEYLGMGDSFAAGQGAFNYIEGTDTTNNVCHLSSKSYPFLISASLFASGHTVACSGAVTWDILANSDEYKGQVKDDTRKKDRQNVDSILSNFTPGYLVQTDFIDTHKPEALTISIGGNDIGFGEIVKGCVSPITTQQTCLTTYEDQLELFQRIEKVTSKLQSTYKLIKKPGKRIYVVGYPHIVVAGGNCGANVHLNEHEVNMAIAITDYLNHVTRKAAEKMGVFYVDVGDALAGHRMCENNGNQVAINGLTLGNDGGVGSFKFIGGESFHPNMLGHEMLRRAILAKTDNLTAPMPTPNALIPSPDAPETKPSPNAQHTNRPINVTAYADNLSADILISGRPTMASVDASIAALKANTSYTVKLNSTLVGSGSTDVLGNVISAVTPSPGLPAGFYTLHIYGVNIIGQPLDIIKTVYVAATADDYNGDGIPNVSDPCVIIPPSGHDVDKDTVDDACDPLIGDPPVTYTSQVRLTDNSFHFTPP